MKACSKCAKWIKSRLEVAIYIGTMPLISLVLRNVTAMTDRVAWIIGFYIASAGWIAYWYLSAPTIEDTEEL